MVSVDRFGPSLALAGEPSRVHIVACEPPHRLVVDHPETETRTWRIALTLSENADTTLLLFEQILPTDMDIAEVGPGWHWYLDRLAATLANVPMPDWAHYYPALRSTYSQGVSPLSSGSEA